MRLNSIQKKIIEKRRHIYRFCYNKAISTINGENIYYPVELSCPENEEIKKISFNNYYSKFTLRDIIAPDSCNAFSPWVLGAGYSIREQAAFEASNAQKTALANLKAGNIKFFNLRFKSKKEYKWTMNVGKGNINNHDLGFSWYEETGYMKTKEKVRITKDCKIHFNGKDYFLIHPYEKEREKEVVKSYFCALDPGERKFHTLYNPEKEAINVGERASGVIHETMLSLDSLLSRKNKIENKSTKSNPFTKKIRKLNKLQIRHRIRIKNLQTEMHNKTSLFLCENFNNIVIPKLTEKNNIIKKSKRTLKTSTVRKMVALGHCKFVEKLKNKAHEYTDVNVNIETEEYTSQICPRCSRKTKTSQEIYKCKNCFFSMDRDFLGSRNILLKNWGLLEASHAR